MNNTLQDELNFEEPSPQKQGAALQLSYKSKPMLDEEEFFEGSSTFRSLYRFE